MARSEADRRLLAGHVAGRADLLDVRLRRANVVQERFQEHGGAVLKFSFDATPSASHEEGERLMSVQVDYALVVHEEDDEADALPVARLEFTYAALFDVQQDETAFSDDEVASFAQTTGAFALYPYAREYVQDATSRLGLPPLTLGLFKPVLPDEDVDDTDNRQ